MFYDIYVDLCNKKDISPSRAAETVGLSRTSVVKWKAGTIPSGATLNALAQFFNVTVDYLMGNGQKEKPFGEAEGQEVSFDDFTYAMHDETKELTEENKQKLLEMARFFKEQQDKKKKQ